MIIAAYAGTGKTTLANTHPYNFTDFVCVPFKYILPENCGKTETCKADPDNIMRDEWPYNYADAIRSAIGEGKHLLIPADSVALILLLAKTYLIYSVTRSEAPKRSTVSVF